MLDYHVPTRTERQGRTNDMAKFLTTTGISYQLEEIIKGADERLLLISPFLKVNPRLRELLEDKNRMKIDVHVIYGKKDLQPEENSWLESMTSIKTSFCQALHAKCYLNEKRALLTSMNLYEYSQVNNLEMGVLVSREEDPELYDEIHEEAKRILRASNEVRTAPFRGATAGTGPQNPAPKPRRRERRRREPSRPDQQARERRQPRLQTRPRRVSASGAGPPYQPIRPSHTADAATEAGNASGTGSSRRSTVTSAGPATRRLCSNPPACPASENSRTLWNSPPADRANSPQRLPQHAGSQETLPRASRSAPSTPKRSSVSGGCSHACSAAQVLRLRGCGRNPPAGAEGPATGIPNRTVPGARNRGGDQCQGRASRPRPRPEHGGKGPGGNAPREVADMRYQT